MPALFVRFRDYSTGGPTPYLNPDFIQQFGPMFSTRTIITMAGGERHQVEHSVDEVKEAIDCGKSLY